MYFFSNQHLFFSKLILFFIFLTTLIYNNSSNSHDYYFGKLTIDHPYIFETMPGAKVAAGYMIITNKGKKSDFLVGGETAFANKMEFHQMKMVDGIMRMKSLENGIEIPAGESVKLEPKGYHIMFMGINSKLIKNSKEKVLLNFKNTGKIIVEFNIESMDHKNNTEEMNHTKHE